MRSRGTKETQGINGDAAALQRWAGVAAGIAPGALAACPYTSHRPTDWVTPESQVTCGVCHPAAAEYEGIRRRGEDGFTELAAAAATRIVVRPRCLTCNGRLSEQDIAADEIYCRGCS